MNTNDFYKELMSEYSFDYEKIRKAAMGKSVQAKKSRLKTPVMRSSSSGATGKNAWSVPAAAQTVP